ncbi:MAG TPA: bifunctional DNA primase/polymerase [Streptosporangiaceae bacterium]|jgi:hypothetical protein
MVEVMLRRERRRQRDQRERIALAARQYAGLGWPVCPGAHPPGIGESGRACSCDRIGCPAPGAHPVSPVWQMQASADPAEVARWWLTAPDANLILVTGRVFEVLDVPAAVGLAAIDALRRADVTPGPVAASAGGRALFFVATRGVPATEDEWWSCHLDCIPDSPDQTTGLRWHCRDSYVLAPPSRHGRGLVASWILDPADHPLPDPVLLLEFLADASAEAAQ